MGVPTSKGKKGRKGRGPTYERDEGKGGGYGKGKGGNSLPKSRWVE